MNARRVRVRAPAKINLSLAVLGRRGDGFHELDTVLMALELGDVLEASEQEGDGCALAVRGPAAAGVPVDASNLAVLAVEALRPLARDRGLAPAGVRLVLEKHVPPQAGLGGSSDAAAAAFACAELWGLDPDDPALLPVLAELGSDCPFFLAARRTGLARCTGRGERVEPLERLDLPWTLVVLTPDFGCATASVYRALTPLRAAARPPVLDLDELGSPSLERARRALSNDLEEPAARSHPDLAAFRACLEEHAPGVFRLAGSGSSCFGFFPDANAAEAVLARVEAASRGRRYALRSRWIGPAESRGMERLDTSSH